VEMDGFEETVKIPNINIEEELTTVSKKFLNRKNEK
jgi:hypothetical protein